jgi:hypothetical protein
MRPIEEYFDKADALAQDVVNAWGVNVQAGNSGFLAADFNDLLDKACRFRTMKRLADNHREFGMLTETDAAEVVATRQAFAEAYRRFWEQHQN